MPPAVEPASEPVNIKNTKTNSADGGKTVKAGTVWNPVVVMTETTWNKAVSRMLDGPAGSPAAATASATIVVEEAMNR